MAIVAFNVNLEAQERQNPVLQFDFVSIEDADRFRFMEFLSFSSEMNSLRISKKVLLTFFMFGKCNMTAIWEMIIMII